MKRHYSNRYARHLAGISNTRSYTRGQSDNKVEVIVLGNFIKSDNSIKLMTTQSPLLRNFLNIMSNRTSQ